jgi:cysteinyl-tRNA synthetase
MVIHAAKVETEEDAPAPELLALLEERKTARIQKDFAASDRLRDQISALGWVVQDSKEGQKLVKKER